MIQRLILIGLVIVLSVGLTAQIAQNPPGSGTITAPYLISTMSHLYWITADSSRWHAHYRQTGDIDASETGTWFNGQGFPPIATYNNKFDGSYDGNGHTISSLYINRAGNSSLFSNIEDAVIQNLILSGANISVGGLLIGTSTYSLIQNCMVNGTIGRGGGLLLGEGWNTTIINCHATGTVSRFGERTGGLCGSLMYSSISNSTVNVELNEIQQSNPPNQMIGGMVGDLSSSTMTNCSAIYEINSANANTVGGLIGLVTYSTIIKSYCEGTINGTGIELSPMIGRMRQSNLRGAHYDVTACSVNNEHFVDIGALDSSIYNLWMDSTMNLDIEDYFEYDGERYLIDGVQDFPYLMAFAQYPDYNYKLVNDIDLSTYPGYLIPYLGGDLDGNGYSIHNFFVHSNQRSRLGFIGLSEANEIRDLSIIDCDLYGGFTTGALIGMCERDNIVTNCFASGTIFAGMPGNNQPAIGGLIGLMEHSEIDSCGSEVNLTGATGNLSIGGLIGRLSYSEATNCSYHGTVLLLDETMLSSYVGGLVGMMDMSTISHSRTDATVTGNRFVGGLVGSCYGTIYHCYSTGSVHGNEHVGGLVGLLEGEYQTEPVIRESCSTATVTGGISVGALVGTSYSIVLDSYARGSVSGEDVVGGLVGNNTIGYYVAGSISRSYSTGLVSSTGQNQGGLVGASWYSLPADCYWDIESSGQTTSEIGIGMTTDQMTHVYDPSCYEDWDFGTIWFSDPTHSINNGYPYLSYTMPGTANQDPVVPVNPILLSVYPNPAAISPTISFSLMNKGESSLEIFNIRGQLIRSIELTNYDRGAHKLSWDRKDQAGKPLGAGLYFVRLSSGGRYKSSKLILF